MILKTNQKRIFDPNRTEDYMSAKTFFQTTSWKHEPFGCPFLLEKPHISIPTLLKAKLLNFLFENYIETT